MGDNEPHSLSSGSETAPDPDWKPQNHHEKTVDDNFILTLNKKDWVEKLVPHADRARMSTADIFFFCAQTIAVGGADPSKIQLSAEWIRQVRIEAERKKAEEIRLSESREDIK